MTGEALKKYMDVEVLRKHYAPAVATAISKYLEDFMVYLSNFGTITASFCKHDAQMLLTLDCPLFVTPPAKNSTNTNNTGNTSNSNSSGGPQPLTVAVVFPAVFPTIPPFCSVVPGGAYQQWRVRQPSRVVAANGAVQLPELSLLKGATPPYSLLEVLLALTEQFELEFPLLPAGKLTPPRPATSTQGRNKNINNAVATTMTEEERRRTIQRAAEALMLHMLSKADGYLDTREESLRHLRRLYRCGGAMREARTLLEQRKADLLRFSPELGKVEKITTTLEQLPDKIEVHSMCIVPADDLQARALELLGEIHASDDSLELLERALKAGQLSCEEYVRRVSDVGREQFEARFLFGRVTEAVNRSSSGSGRRLPQSPPRVNATHRRTGEPIKVPKKLENEGVLLREFPEVGTEMIKAVLNLANGSLEEARVQLKAMLS
ncbi:Steadiness box (SB) domain [Trypanosoma melophagium]|uniref:Steadiness box (SB) domain n=1 Tax=Trypanosoma melophagium TaxID=715481 RepID=UPI00351A212F|nr:Steadiness box (SB) domain [Trypanosoma melophagium]